MNLLIKFADDTAVIRFIQNDDDTKVNVKTNITLIFNDSVIGRILLYSWEGKKVK